MTQRLVKALQAAEPAPYTDEELDAIARNCTEKEDAARKVQRNMLKRMAAVAMQHRIGQTFPAIVTGASEKGVFVRVLEPTGGRPRRARRTGARRRRPRARQVTERRSATRLHRFCEGIMTRHKRVAAYLGHARLSRRKGHARRTRGIRRLPRRAESPERPPRFWLTWEICSIGRSRWPTANTCGALRRRLAWDAGMARFFAALEAFDRRLASDQPLGTTPEKLFQGPIADALTHTGQIAMLRRLAGCPFRGENYFAANIETGRVGADQAAPVLEFD